MYHSFKSKHIKIYMGLFIPKQQVYSRKICIYKCTNFDIDKFDANLRFDLNYEHPIGICSCDVLYDGAQMSDYMFTIEYKYYCKFCTSCLEIDSLDIVKINFYKDHTYAPQTYLLRIPYCESGLFNMVQSIDEYFLKMKNEVISNVEDGVNFGTNTNSIFEINGNVEYIPIIQEYNSLCYEEEMVNERFNYLLNNYCYRLTSLFASVNIDNCIFPSRNHTHTQNKKKINNKYCNLFFRLHNIKVFERIKKKRRKVEICNIDMLKKLLVNCKMCIVFHINSIDFIPDNPSPSAIRTNDSICNEIGDFSYYLETMIDTIEFEYI